MEIGSVVSDMKHENRCNNDADFLTCLHVRVYYIKSTRKRYLYNLSAQYFVPNSSS
jgi:hypothetical protein